MSSLVFISQCLDNGLTKNLLQVLGLLHFTGGLYRWVMLFALLSDGREPCS